MTDSLLIESPSVMPPIRLVIFDIAGTLIEDRGEGVPAFSGALQNNGIRFTETELKRCKGASKREVIRHFVVQLGWPIAKQTEKVEATYRCFHTERKRLYSQPSNPIDGAAATFAWCRRHAIHIATTTGFCREMSDLILEKMGWRAMFTANISSSDVRLGRPAPS